MRQPGGTSLLTPLRKETAMLRGFPLSGTHDTEYPDAAGAKHRGTRAIETVSIKTARVSKRLFRVPSGYSLFKPESIEFKPKDLPKSKKGDLPICVHSP